MKKIRTILFLLVALLSLASCDLWFQPGESKTTTINHIVLDDKAILLQNGKNQISFRNPDDKILCTFAIYNPSSYPSDENASFSIHSSFLNSKQVRKGIGDKETVYPALQMDGMEAELFYVSPNIRFFYLSGGGYPEICDATKEYFKDRIASYATIYEWILQREANLIFGHDYVDVDGNGYFTVYLFSDDEIANVMGLVYPEEAQDRDIFYVNTSNYELMISEKGEEAGTVEYEKAFATIFVHELFHYMDEQARGDHERENYFMVEGMACFVASLMEKELGLIDNYGNMMFKNSYLYHPMKTNSTTGYLTSDYHVGCDFWAYIWNVYGQDTFKAMIPYHDTIEAIETVLDEDFRTVYREFLLSVLGSSGQPVEGQRIFPDAEQYQLEDSWSLLQALTLSVADGDPTSFIGGSVKDVDTEIAPFGFDVKVWYDNPDILTVNAEPGVEIYAFTASEYFLDYLNLLYGML